MLDLHHPAKRVTEIPSTDSTRCNNSGTKLLCQAALERGSKKPTLLQSELGKIMTLVESFQLFVNFTHTQIT